LPTPAPIRKSGATGAETPVDRPERFGDFVLTDTSTGARPITIGLLFHSLTSGNLGVGALTVANMAIADRVAREEGLDPTFVSIGMRDGDAPDVSGGRVESVVVERRTLFSREGLWRAFGRCDCVLDISGGDSFTDIYSGKRLFFMMATKAMVLARRVPLVLSPMTIGPFDRPRNQRLAGWIMNRAHAVVARDDQSLAVAKTLAPGAALTLAADVAFELPFEDRSAERADRGGSDRLRVGINASGLLFHQAETGANRYGLSIDYAAYTRNLIAALVARGHEVHLVPHVRSAMLADDDDSALRDRLHAEFPETVPVPDFPGPSEAKAYISSLDFLVAGRMHACIGAVSAGTPVVPVAYSRKFGGLFGMLGYDWMVPVTGMTTDRALAYTLDALDRRADLAAAEAAAMARVTAKLDAYRAVLRSLFRGLAR
jgi:polysaccharide pyruvyl transferase WcaK-like protein